MLDLWEAFNDVAEGFGLTIIEFREMLQCSVKEYLGFNEKRLVEVADIVFRAFDDDKVIRCSGLQPCHDPDHLRRRDLKIFG